MSQSCIIIMFFLWQYFLDSIVESIEHDFVWFETISYDFDYVVYKQ